MMIVRELREILVDCDENMEVCVSSDPHREEPIKGWQGTEYGILLEL